MYSDTYHDSGDNYVEICWYEPYDKGTPISSYTIYLENSDWDFIEDTDLCDGSDADVISDQCCTFSLDALHEDPYYWEGGDEMYWAVVATNAEGDSDWTYSDDYILIYSKEAGPTGITVDEYDEDSVTISWDATTSMGGADVEEFYLYVYNDSGSQTWEFEDSVIAAGSYTYTFEGLNAGDEYYFKVTSNTDYYESYDSNSVF